MEVSRLSFTKKTQENMKKDMSVREKGKILFSRLEEMDNDGTLSKAKTRADVARLVGYPGERAKAGYAWVSNLIRRGHLSETIQEWTPSGKIIAEYHITGSMPDYGYEEVNRRRAKKEKMSSSEWEKWQNHEIEAPIHKDTTIEAPNKNASIKMEITKGDITIKAELAEVEQASKLITTIIKGE